jgi:signal transduction histidine kinase
VLLPRDQALPSRGAWAVLAAGAVAIGAYYLLPTDGQNVLYVGIGLTAVAAAATRAWLRSEARAAWACFAAGLFCSTAGDAISAWYVVHLDRQPPTPSVADWFYLAGYPFLAAGIGVLLWRLGGRSLGIALFDTAVVGAAVLLVQWAFFVSQYVHEDAAAGERVVDMAYPLLDVLLLVGVLQLLSGPVGRSTATRLIVAALLLWVVGDEIYGIWAASYVPGDWMDAFWLASYVAWAAAALDTSPTVGVRLERRARPRLSARRTAVLGACVLAPPVVLLVERLRHDPVNAIFVGVVGLLVTVLVLTRFVALTDAYDRARREERAARKEAERVQALLASQNEELKEVDRLKDEFVSSVSHELRTPLTSISGFVELLLEHKAGKQTDEYLRIVERNADRLLALVEDLLFAARVRSGQLALEVAPVDLRVLAAEAVAAMRPAAEHAGVSLDVEGRAVPVVRGDARRLREVLDNLLSNAVKFTPTGGAVTLALSSDGDHAAVEVTDTGMGLDESERERVFERFFRTRAARDQQVAGTGLGLYIAKAIVESHGGTIAVRSAPGVGSTFRVELPGG